MKHITIDKCQKIVKVAGKILEIVNIIVKK